MIVVDLVSGLPKEIEDNKFNNRMKQFNSLKEATEYSRKMYRKLLSWSTEDKLDCINENFCLDELKNDDNPTVKKAVTTKLNTENSTE